MQSLARGRGLAQSSIRLDRRLLSLYSGQDKERNLKIGLLHFVASRHLRSPARGYSYGLGEEIGGLTWVRQRRCRI